MTTEKKEGRKEKKEGEREGERVGGKAEMSLVQKGTRSWTR